MLVSFASLFLSALLLLLGLGGTAPLDALSGAFLGFSEGQIGLLGSAHFLGFFIGCWWAPRLMGEVGHSRAFAAFTASGTIGIMAHMMLLDPFAWMLMRIAVGMALAGCFTIIEAWLQSKVTNETRGRAMGVYRVVDIFGSLGAQLLIGVVEPATYVSYNILALICCATLFPLVLSRAEAPQAGAAPRLRPGLAWRRSPLAVAGVIVSGISGAAFRMVGPLYGVLVGLEPERIAFFLASYVLGGAVAQLPVGWIADKFDRRIVLIWLSVASAAACVITLLSQGFAASAIFLSASLFGFTTFPIYSVAAAHAHDFAESDERVELSAALLFLYAVGATASPVIASLLIASFRPPGMFGFLALSHVALVVFGIIRMRARPAPAHRSGYVYVPRTSFLIGRLLRRNRDQ
ncbi:MFS transporter [Phaeovulum sp. NW3]|uniref:MFS transporter n=1 Tax=Phaeovulum sp. NW3 TaxID=2934933 RepID=UPI00202013CC|nr:MFS transporter [Phaeovulum sp. NW3]MCL7466800.1 MFS transporter [Phaeovulum sp. NW3]